MPVAAIGGRHPAAMGAAEKLRGGPTWRPGGGGLLLPGRRDLAGHGGPGGSAVRQFRAAGRFSESRRQLRRA